VAGKVASRSRTLHSAGAVATAPSVGSYGRGRQPYRSQWQGWRPTGPAPPPKPVRSQERKSRVRLAPLRGLSVLAVPEQAARRHGTGTDRAAQSPPPHWWGWAPSWGVGAAAPGREPWAHDGAAPPMSGHLMPAYGSGRVHAERPRAKRTPSEGRADPRARRSPLEGGAPPRTGRSPPEGGAHPRARRSLFEGAFEWAAWWAAGAFVAWAMSCVVK
jgi:hypothetical protein